MKKSAKFISVLIGVSLLCSFLQSEEKKRPQKPEHIYDKLKCDSLEIEHRISSINLLLSK
jgi:hypothetical protein